MERSDHSHGSDRSTRDTSIATNSSPHQPVACLETYSAGTSLQAVQGRDQQDELLNTIGSVDVPNHIPSSMHTTHPSASPASDSPAPTPPSPRLTPQLQDSLDAFIVPAALQSPSQLTFATLPSELSADNSTQPAALPRRTNPGRSHVRSQTLAHATYTPTPPLRTTSPSESTTPPDFLTLLASQERRVLELKEELCRAETELTTLKKQWAVHEANKKKGEFRNGGVVKMDMMESRASAYSGQPVHSHGPYVRGHGRSATLASAATGLGLGLGLALDENRIDEHSEIAQEASVAREKRRSMMQDRIRKRGTTMESGSSHSPMLGRRSSQRVFSGSRHTRTLSLLTTTVPKPTTTRSNLDTASELSATADNPVPHSTNLNDENVTDDQAVGFPSLTRTGSNFARELNFGKTYKELASAASKRSLPQSADALMKHGKVVVDGVRDGLWNFFEDIRQATVGDEAAREADGSSERSGDSQKKVGGHTPQKMPRGGVMKARNSKENLKASEHSFWKEFGLETPKADRQNTLATQAVSRKDRANPGTEYTPKPANKAQRAVKSVATGVNSSGPTQGAAADQVEGLSASNSDFVSRRDSADLGIEDAAQPTTTTPPSHALKKEYHHSHSSTDSGDSRDSRNPPSLMLDSPTTTTVTNDTDTEEDEGLREETEDDSWDWKDENSPTRDRQNRSSGTSRGMGAKVQVGKTSGTSSGKDGVRDGSKDYEWHALTR